MSLTDLVNGFKMGRRVFEPDTEVDCYCRGMDRASFYELIAFCAGAVSCVRQFYDVIVHENFFDMPKSGGADNREHSN